ncbi:hypothetical protein HNQ38_001176 [Desulfovibrio intestinalis]|uniref:Uncharacterized protein n=1 Tax=Desulfovibrio intestinalis TaxID=58621 RepID=A0A7W8FER5_9BACT|nr:hypothetical protein [Desulfovibrio intestinalis]
MRAGSHAGAGISLLEQTNIKNVYLLCADFYKNSRHKMLARRTHFAAKQAFQSENVQTGVEEKFAAASMNGR